MCGGKAKPRGEDESFSGIEQQWGFSSHVRFQAKAVQYLSWLCCPLGCSTGLKCKDLFCKAISSCVVFGASDVYSGSSQFKGIFSRSVCVALGNHEVEIIPISAWHSEALKFAALLLL